RPVRTVVDGVDRARLEEERQVDPGADENDEAVERDLPEQERPVIGEDVAQRAADQRRRARTLVEVADEFPDHGFGFCIRTPHQDGPTGWSKLPRARSSPFASTSSGSCGSARPAGPKMTVPPVAGSNVE